MSGDQNNSGEPQVGTVMDTAIRYHHWITVRNMMSLFMFASTVATVICWKFNVAQFTQLMSTFAVMSTFVNFALTVYGYIIFAKLQKIVTRDK